jgi:hypothetical protein
MTNGRLSRRIWRFCPKGARSGHMPCARYSTGCVYREDGRAVAVDAERPAAVGDRLPAGAAVVARGLLRDLGRGPARHPASDGGGAQRAADGSHHRQPDFALESGPRAAYDGAKRKKGSKLHRAVDTLVICWPCTSRRRTLTIALRSDASPRPFRLRPARASRSLLSIRDTSGKSQRQPPPNTALSLR